MSMREQTLHRCFHRIESDNETLPHPLHNFQTTLPFLFQFENIESLQILQRNLSVSLYTVLSSGKTFPQLRKSHFQIKTVLQPVSTLQQNHTCHPAIVRAKYCQTAKKNKAPLNNLRNLRKIVILQICYIIIQY